MGKGKKKQPLWQVFLKGAALSVGVYLAGHLLLAALAVRGTIGESFPAAAVLGVLSAFCGGLCVVRRCPWGPLPGGLALAALFGAVIALTGVLCWGNVSWTGRDAAVLGAVLLGGALAGLAGAGGKKRKRRAPL